MKFNKEIIFKIIMAIVSVLFGANEYVAHKEHQELKEQISSLSSEESYVVYDHM